MLDRPEGFLYHLGKGSGAARKSLTRKIPVNIREASGKARASKKFYCLEADLAELRKIGADKGVVDAGATDIGGTSGEGRPIQAIKIGNGPHVSLITGCYHAREWISVEIPFLIAEYLVTEYPKGDPKTPEQKRLKHLLHNRTVWIVPLCNPDGHEKTVTVNRLWRANTARYTPGDAGMPAKGFKAPVADGIPNAPRVIDYDRSGGAFYVGVDVNRNHDVKDKRAAWGHETFRAKSTSATTSRNPEDCALSHRSGNVIGRQVWCGPSAASEPETKAMEAFVKGLGVKTSLHYHSCGGFYLYPDAFVGGKETYTKWLGAGVDKLITQAPGSKAYQVGRVSDVLYPATGSAMDFCREASGDMPTYSPELRPVKADMKADWSNLFSHMPESEIWPTFLENLCPALAVINAAGFDKPAEAVEAELSSAKPAAKGQMVRNAWKVFEGWTYPAKPGP